MDATTSTDEIRQRVRERYAERALRVLNERGGESGGCCAGASCDPICTDLYAPEEAAAIPADALRASLGCGNPSALADLAPGEVVLDLGSGGGVDVLLSARRVGPTGFVYGLDMTDEMLALAERNRRAQGATNVRFLKGEIEAIPLADQSVDVVISNCVINLSADKGRVLREAFRVLRPGGRFAVADIVVQGALPDEVRRDLEAWAGCLAGALEEREYRRLLAEAGFEEIEVEVTRVHDPAELGARAAAGAGRAEPAVPVDPLEARVVSAFVRARRPGTH